MRQAGEPSVEEILDSIKKVIARDNRASATETRRTRETAGVSARTAGEADEDVLDLADTDAITESSPAARPESLLNESSLHSMQENFAALAMLSTPGARPQIVRSGETSLEGLVRELLRPALADWLEKNLPPLVERMVADEIARIAGKKP